jgi:hypothetical protein
MNFSRILGALTCAVLISASAASASASERTYPGQRPVSNSHSLAAIQAGLEFWREQPAGRWTGLDVEKCPGGVRVYTAASLRDTDGDADGRGGDCEAWISRAWLHELRSDWTYAGRRDSLAIECSIWRHELGHALGIVDHVPGTVMDAAGSAPDQACKQLARAFFPSRYRRGHLL